MSLGQNRAVLARAGKNGVFGVALPSLRYLPRQRCAQTRAHCERIDSACNVVQIKQIVQDYAQAEMRARGQALKEV